jgi:PAS domain S-box-containing protein
MTGNEPPGCGIISEPADSDDLFRAVFETSRTGIMLIDPEDGTILGANPAARELFGRSDEEMLGHGLDEFVSSALPGRSPNRDLLRSAGTYESVLINANGKKTHVLMNLSSAFSRGHTVLVVNITDLRDHMNEKAILLRELHHRVKNNMQMIMSILDLEGEKIRDPSIQILFENSKNRIRALTAVHEIAYRSSDFAHIPVEKLITTIVSSVLSSRSDSHGEISLDISAGTATLDLDAAVPFGILINELVSNSSIHAFPDGRDGRIEILYRPGANSCILEYQDDGVGFPSGIDFENPKTTGLELIHILAGEMNGKVVLSGSPGTHYRFTFPGKELVRRSL